MDGYLTLRDQMNELMMIAASLGPLQCSKASLCTFMHTSLAMIQMITSGPTSAGAADEANSHRGFQRNHQDL